MPSANEGEKGRVEEKSPLEGRACVTEEVVPLWLTLTGHSKYRENQNEAAK